MKAQIQLILNDDGSMESHIEGDGKDLLKILVFLINQEPAFRELMRAGMLAAEQYRKWIDTAANKINKKKENSKVN